MKIKNLIVQYKEYLPLIILIPTLIGGSTQLIRLSWISISYVRFFSISQSLADGLLTLIVFVILLIVLIIQTIIGQYLIQFKRKILSENRSKFYKYTMVLITNIAYLFSILFLALLFFNKYVSMEYEIRVFDVILHFFVTLIISLLGSLLISWNDLNNDISYQEDSDKENQNQSGFKTLLVITLIAISLSVWINFSHSKIENIKNYNNLISYLKSVDSKIENHKVLYFNDKYIFTEVRYIKGTKENMIMKFDTLFDF